MIYDKTRRQVLAVSPRNARSFLDRLRGMIGRDFADTPFDAMIFERCNAIHTCGMKIPIDAIFLDRRNRICRIAGSVPPWRFVMGGSAAVAVIEMAAGKAAELGAAAGDEVEFLSVPAADNSSSAGCQEIEKS